MLKRFLLLVSAVFVLAVIVSCGDDDKGTNTDKNKIPSELVGTWILDSLTSHGYWVDPVPLLGSVSARITVGAQGSFVLEGLDSQGAVVWADSGTISVNGNSFTTAIDNPYFTGGTWEVNRDQLTLTIDVTIGDVVYEIKVFATKE
jgi:hypothetical protein